MTDKRALNADMNIIAASNLTITPLNGSFSIIQQLDDEPNDVGGLTAQELKAKFDEAGLTIQSYINGTLIPEVLGAEATEEQREADEAQRQASETARQTAEAGRAAAENGRVSAEGARAAAETARAAAFAASQTERAAAFEQAQAERDEEFSESEEARNFWEDYDAAKAYVPGNKVYYLGSSYVNTAPCTGVLPTVAANWQMIAKKGADSDEGMSQEEADLRYLQLAGGVMTGAVKVLSPTENANPATKQYVDTKDAGTLSSAKTYADNKTAEYAYSKQQSLKASTATAYGLTAAAAPDDVLAKALTLIQAAQTAADNKTAIYTGQYTGTGAYGQEYPNQITFPVAPKLVLLPSAQGASPASRNYSGESFTMVNMADLTTEYAPSLGFGANTGATGDYFFPYAKKSKNGKSLYWYNNDSSGSSGTGGGGSIFQCNSSGMVYRWIAFV